MLLVAKQDLPELLVLAPAPRERRRGRVALHVRTEQLAVRAHANAAGVGDVPVDLVGLEVSCGLAIEVVPVYREDAVGHERREEEEMHSVQLVPETATHPVDTEYGQRPHSSSLFEVIQPSSVECLVAFQRRVEGGPGFPLRETRMVGRLLGA